MTPGTAVGSSEPVRLDRPFLATEAILAATDLDSLFLVLRERGYRTCAPTVRDGVVRITPATSAAQLPAGIRDRQAPGSYALEGSLDEELFGYAVGPDSLKSTLFPPETTLFETPLPDGGIPTTTRRVTEAAPTAVIGVRPCDIAALATLGRVLIGGTYPDPVARERRRLLFTVAVECGRPADTCFCTSFAAGPDLDRGADLILTELRSPHRFLVRPGSAEGVAVLRALPTCLADSDDTAERARVLEEARSAIKRVLPVASIESALQERVDAPRWETVADRCLACSNCTMVCPTCFCSTISETTDLAGTARRERRWASCFEASHSLLSNGPVRQSVSSRYRQWATHKLSTWRAQFGTAGCVGCGRCVTWCPAGIDLVTEASAIALPTSTREG